MSVERTYRKDVDRFRLDREKQAVVRTRPQEPERELTLEDLADRLSMLESKLVEVKEVLKEIKEVMMTFGFEFDRAKKMANVALKRRASDRKRQRRFQKRRSEE